MPYFFKYFIIIINIYYVRIGESLEYSIVQEKSSEKISEFFVCLYDEHEFKRFDTNITKLQSTFEDQKEAFEGFKTTNEKQVRNMNSILSTIQKQENYLRNINSSINTDFQSLTKQHNADLKKATIILEKKIEGFEVTNMEHSQDLRNIQLSLQNVKEEIEISNKKHDEDLRNVQRTLQKINEGVQSLNVWLNENLKNLISTCTEELKSKRDNTMRQSNNKINNVSLIKGDFKNRQKQPTNCNEAIERYGRSGVYNLYTSVTNKTSYSAYCIESNDGFDAWTVIQRRQDGSENFHRGWMDYRNGFGNLSGEFWLGSERIHQLTTETPHELLINMQNDNGEWLTAHYDHFVVGNEFDKYPLLKLGKFSGNVGDSLSKHILHKFSTKDSDKDAVDINCAAIFQGAWWYHDCYNCNLNGLYLKNDDMRTAIGMGIIWLTYKSDYSLKHVSMRIRPRANLADSSLEK